MKKTKTNPFKWNTVRPNPNLAAGRFLRGDGAQTLSHDLSFYKNTGPVKSRSTKTTKRAPPRQLRRARPREARITQVPPEYAEHPERYIEQHPEEGLMSFKQTPEWIKKNPELMKAKMEAGDGRRKFRIFY